MGNQPIQVLIVDDHDMLRKGLAQVLLTEPDLQLVGEGSNGLQAIRLCERLKPDVLLLDIQMPAMGGLKAAQQIRASHPQIRIIMLTSFVRADEIKDALKLGVIGYLSKDVSAAAFVAAIRAAYAGELQLGQMILDELVADLQRSPEPDYDLSKREEKIAGLMAQGLANKQIAQHLYLSLPTIKHHASSLMRKLNVQNRTSVARLAIKNKWDKTS